ncbi:uncharacterized protein [Miscanthus floridulus]|uniref:uncharacterized protein isoform X2 n=1 Tax=Miscanthus floridulus TaxID=154761 RepID=UPI00345940CA
MAADSTPPHRGSAPLYPSDWACASSVSGRVRTRIKSSVCSSAHLFRIGHERTHRTAPVSGRNTDSRRAAAAAAASTMAPAFSAHVPALRRGALRVRWVTAALFSSGILAGNKPVLVRDFVRSALYDPNHGYFSKRAGPVGVLDASIRFNQFEGRSAYIQHLDKLYKKHDIAWFTPVELFKPWYAYAIAASILRTANLSVPLKIYEIGGGSGTCAKCILDYMMLNAPPKVYNDMKYISVEISSSLAEKQLETVGEVQSHLSKFTVEHRDAINRPGWGRKDPHPCWVLLLEVLDNLPHDLVYSPDQVSPWMEVWIEKVNGSSQASEVYKPLQDPLISRCVDIIGMKEDKASVSEKLAFAAKGVLSKVFPKPRRAWLPTGCLISAIFRMLAYLVTGLHWFHQRRMGRHQIIATTLMLRVTRTSSSQRISGSWSRSTITALASQRSRRILAHSNP